MACILSLPLLVLVVQIALGDPLAVMGADNPPTSQPAPTDTSSAVKPHMVTHNADGTFTIQNGSVESGAGGTEKKGLVIPPQVVVPTISTPEHK